ncbi:MAG: hypothetical protein K9H49_06990 [Bacteroidales bacterium]|nr:hypothetical protein [Bacteroidales bacterium]MCF8404124.1 hypothetical protein [Bacteroidales bacterium]
MSKVNSLYFLVNSMTRSERKAFMHNSKRPGKVPEYLKLYKLIEQDKGSGVDTLKLRFLSICPGGAYESTVKYLFKVILETILELRKEQDVDFSLMNGIMKAKILFEKSLFEECFALLKWVIGESKRLENFYTLLLASRLEIEYLLELNFPALDEKKLLSKHIRISKTLRAIMKINDQSSIYELLKHRLIYKGNVRSQEQKNELNDLVVSEISILSSTSPENFEINKLHQLFQANYLISVGDYKSAFRSFSELNRLFENNKHLWNNPPIYYLQTVEGVLDSLRGIRNYEGMNYFVGQLEKLESPSINFSANVNSLIFLYKLYPKLDRGDFTDSLDHLNKGMKTIYTKMKLLSLTRQAELYLYAALVYFTNRKYREAHSYLKNIIIEGKEFSYLPLYRTIRLTNLMILYELKDFDLIEYEARSIKRGIRKMEKGYLLEKAMLRFINSRNAVQINEKKDGLWKKIIKDLDFLSQDVFEGQVLKIFEFTAWIKSKITKEALSEILKSKHIHE